MTTLSPLALASTTGFSDLSSTQAAKAPLISSVVLAGSMRIAELAVITGLGGAIAAAYIDMAPGVVARYTLTAALTALLSIGIFQIMGLYAVPAMQRRARALPRVIAGWSLSVMTFVGLIFFMKIGMEFSRFWLISWFTSSAAAIILIRLAVAEMTRTWVKTGRLNRRAVVYGSGPSCDALLRSLATDKETDIRVCGVFDDRARDPVSQVEAAAPNRGKLDDLVAFARSSRVDLVLLALPISAEARLITLLQRLWVLPADICLAASSSQLRLSPRAYSYAGGVALIALADKPIQDWGVIAKGAFDKLIGCVALVALAPVMVATAIAIRLDSKGPILFRQKRYGFNNELIEVFKFRSMHNDQADANASKLVTKDDARVTRVGRFIRKTSLDELPQLFNVLIGNLSLVGPRPHAVSAKAAGKLYDEAVDGYFARHKVKPGITGWAQINGWRGETDTEDKLRHRIEHDLYYIENWSVFFDAYILLKTPLSLLKTDNAY